MLRYLDGKAALIATLSLLFACITYFMCIDPVCILECCALNKREDLLCGSLYCENMTRPKDPPYKKKGQELKSRTVHCVGGAVYYVWKQYVVFEQVRMCVYYCAHTLLFTLHLKEMQVC